MARLSKTCSLHEALCNPQPPAKSSGREPCNIHAAARNGTSNRRQHPAATAIAAAAKRRGALGLGTHSGWGGTEDGGGHERFLPPQAASLDPLMRPPRPDTAGVALGYTPVAQHLDGR